jgi:hypothetical protein
MYSYRLMTKFRIEIEAKHRSFAYSDNVFFFSYIQGLWPLYQVFRYMLNTKDELSSSNTIFPTNIDFLTLSIVMLFIWRQRFGDWFLSPSSGKKEPTQLGPIDRSNPYHRTAEIEQYFMLQKYSFNFKTERQLQEYFCNILLIQHNNINLKYQYIYKR